MPTPPKPTVMDVLAQQFAANKPPRKFQPAGRASPPSVLPSPEDFLRPIRVFISHDSRDKHIAEALVDYIQGRVKIPSSAIRCTSLDRCMLPNGVAPDEVIPDELRHADVVLGVITPNARESDWVMFELGACWGRGKTPICVLLPGANVNTLPKPLRGPIAVHLDNTARMLNLGKQVSDATGYPLEDDVLKPHQAITDLMAFAASLKNSEPVPAVPAAPPLRPEELDAQVARILRGSAAYQRSALSGQLLALGDSSRVLGIALGSLELVLHDVEPKLNGMQFAYFKLRLVGVIEQFAERAIDAYKFDPAPLLADAVTAVLRRRRKKGSSFEGYEDVCDVLARVVVGLLGEGTPSKAMMGTALAAVGVDPKERAFDSAVIALHDHGQLNDMPGLTGLGY